MSWLSDDWRKFIAWLSSIESPASKAAAATAGASLQSGLTATETALELIAVDAANAALAFVPVVGPALTPTVDTLLEAIAAKVLSKKSGAPPPTSPPAATAVSAAAAANEPATAGSGAVASGVAA